MVYLIKQCEEDYGKDIVKLDGICSILFNKEQYDDYSEGTKTPLT
jgi:hypothetical protein